jgi:hypothetical protein
VAQLTDTGVIIVPALIVTRCPTLILCLERLLLLLLLLLLVLLPDCCC